MMQLASSDCEHSERTDPSDNWDYLDIRAFGAISHMDHALD